MSFCRYTNTGVHIRKRTFKILNAKFLSDAVLLKHNAWRKPSRLLDFEINELHENSLKNL